MQQSAILGRVTHQQSHHILIIDDNVQLRSLLARHILLNCNNQQRSCAIYHLGERSEPRLNYYNNPANADELEPGEQLPDFTIYEAGSPRHALQWIKNTGIQRLTIISDVMMPVDTEVGLPGLLTGLNQLHVAVNLVFMSSEPQNIEQVQILLNSQRAFFLIKGSEAWTRLPEALVRGADRFNFQVLPKQVYANPAIFPTDRDPITHVSEESQRLAVIKNMGNIQVRSFSKSSVVAGPAMAVAVQPRKAPGFLARLFGRH